MPPVLRRRVAAPAPGKPAEIPASAPRRVIQVKSAPPAKPQQMELPIAPAEQNSDGSSYAETIARYKEKVKNPMTAIRAKCVECCNGSLKEVRECRVTSCALHEFREGKNPYRKVAEGRLGINPFKKGDDEGEDDE